MSGPEHGWPGPLSRGPGPDALKTGPWGQTGSGPGPDLLFLVHFDTILIGIATNMSIEIS